MSTRFEDVIRSIVTFFYVVLAGAVYNRAMNMSLEDPGSITLVSTIFIVLVILASFVFLEVRIATTAAISVSLLIFSTSGVIAISDSNADIYSPDVIFPIIIGGLLAYVLKLRISRYLFPTKD